MLPVKVAFLSALCILNLPPEEKWTTVAIISLLFVSRRWWKSKERRREMVEALGVSAWRWAATLRGHAWTRRSEGRWGGVLTPLLCFITVENNCGYHLFESDSEDEEEEVTEKKDAEEPTKKKSAFQVGERQQNKKSLSFPSSRNFTVKPDVNSTNPCTRVCQLAYNAWVTSSKTALKDLKKEKKTMKKEEKKRTKTEMQEQQGEVAGFCDIIISSPVASICTRAS